MDTSPTHGGTFYKASRFIIQQANIVEKQEINVQRTGTNDDILHSLMHSVAIGALHNSGHRYDAPKCHPGTREAVLKEIMSWVDYEDSKFRVMWLRGPAGAGKSAIAQTVAEKCFDESKLCGTFFFSRHQAERNTSERLTATLAYQLALYVPQSKEYMLTALQEQGPVLFQLSLEQQIQHLIINPLMKAVSQHPEISEKCVIIDGLDECQGTSAQLKNIVESILKVSATPNNPVRFLLVSRPEITLRQAFGDVNMNNFMLLDLDQKYNPENDIDWFLRDRFDKIKYHHPVPLSRGSDWPTNAQIEHIVQKSSGQFIYAATVIRYVENPRFNPIKSLQQLTGKTRSYPGGVNPFGELDKLYMHILDTAMTFNPGIWSKLELIFAALLYLRSVKAHDLLDEFLGLDGDIMSLLVDLHSILRIAEHPSRHEISLHHASFSDFLRDETRSRKYFVREARAHFLLSECCVQCLKDYVSDSSPDKAFPRTFYPAIRGYFHHVNRALQLDPIILCNSSCNITNYGIAYVCKAIIEAGYAKIGFRIQHEAINVAGVLSKNDERTYMIDLANSSKSDRDERYLKYNFDDDDISSPFFGDSANWVFKEMQDQPQLFSIGTYIERGAGYWNHILIDNRIALTFMKNQIFTPVDFDASIIHISVRGELDRKQAFARNFLEWIQSLQKLQKS